MSPLPAHCQRCSGPCGDSGPVHVTAVESAPRRQRTWTLCWRCAPHLERFLAGEPTARAATPEPAPGPDDEQLPWTPGLDLNRLWGMDGNRYR